MGKSVINNKEAYYIQPAFYNSFQCIGGECPQSCCINWRIDWTEEEVDKLRSASCSERLRELIDTSFIAKEKGYYIKLDEKTRCPFLDENSLCSIQKELGEEYLSHTCMAYPRSMRYSNGAIIRTVDLSCCHVLDTLCTNERAMELSYQSYRGKDKKMSIIANREKKDNPVLDYSAELFEFFYRIMADKSKNLETCVVLGAVAAQKITQFAERGKTDMIPKLLNTLEDEMEKANISENMEKLKPNYHLKLCYASIFAGQLRKANLISPLFSQRELGSTEFYPDIALYQRGEQEFEKAFAGRDYVVRNIALNLLFEQFVPFKSVSLSIYDNWCYYVASISVIKLIGASAGVCFSNNPKSVEHGFKLMTASVTRSIDHNKTLMENTLTFMRENGITSPAHLAFFIK